MEEQSHPKLLPTMLILSGLEGLGVLAILVLTKSAEGGIFLGLSAIRLTLAAAVLAITASLFWLGLTWRKEDGRLQKIRQLISRHRTSLVLILAWAAVLFFMLQSEAYYQIIFKPFKRLLSPELFPQLRPLLLWACLTLAQTAIGITLDHRNQFRKENPKNHSFLVWLLLDLGSLVKRSDQPRWQSLWKKHTTSLVLFLGFLLVWMLIAVTKIGLLPDDRFWNIAGVPILWHQIIFVILLILFLLDIQKITAESRWFAFSQKPGFAIILLVLIWLTAVVVWQGEPMKHTYFSPGPYPPNNVKYPFSDAHRFDIGGQYFLMGMGLNNHNLTDRPFLMLHTAILHLLGGQDYERIAFFQITILALIPAFLFLIGWKMHSQTAGLAIAFLTIFKEKNAIATAFKIGLSNPKVLTSELPNALLLVMVSVCLFYWFQPKKNQILWPILAGGLTGLAIGIRGNSLTVLPLVLFLALLTGLKQRNFLKKWAAASLLFLLGAGVVLAPYSIETTQRYGAPFWLIKIQNVIDRSETAFLTNKPAGSLKLTSLTTPSHISDNLNLDDPQELALLTMRHFLHNEITTVLMLPIRWQAQPIGTAIEHPIWETDPQWQGTLSPGEKIALGANLLILALGIGSAFQKWGVTGIVPLGIHLTYNLTNSAARTSGGRYLVPTDWVLSIYFVFGILVLIYGLRQWQHPGSPGRIEKTGRSGLILPAITLLGFLLLGSGYLFSELIPQRFPLNEQTTIWHYLEPQTSKLAEFGIDQNEIEAFSQTQGAVLALGKALYPRYYQAGEPTPISSYLPEIPNEPARLYFLMLEDKTTRHVSIPLGQQVPISFPHGGYGLILGCESEGYTQGILFIPLDPSDSPIYSTEVPILSCD